MKRRRLWTAPDVQWFGGAAVNGSESYHLSNVHLVSLGLPKTSQGSTQYYYTTQFSWAGLAGLRFGSVAAADLVRERVRSVHTPKIFWIILCIMIPIDFEVLYITRLVLLYT